MLNLTEMKKKEILFFLDSADCICYNPVCIKCIHECKQSFRATVVECRRYRVTKPKVKTDDLAKCA